MSKPIHLPRRLLVLYALPSLMTSVAALPMALFVPAFYADELGLPLAAVGAAIAASRLLDVITDPLIGALSDRLRSRWGRRKPWMLLGTPLFAVAVWQVFVPGDGASVGGLLGWAALLYLGFTMIDLPHKAWGAELSSDYDERSRVTSIREALSTLGQVALLGVLVLLSARGLETGAEQLRGMAWVIVVGLPVLVAFALLLVPEGPAPRHAPPRLGFVAGLRILARNPALGRMIGCVPIKLSLAIGVLLGTALPAAFGYDPAAEVIPPEIQARLMLIYGCVPAVMMAAGALFLYRFPITRERHAEVRAQLDARAGALADAERFL